MSYQNYSSFPQTTEASILATNKVLRNTYFLLSLTLLFSAGTAAFAMAMNAPHLGIIISMVGMIGLLFLTQALRNSVWGLVSVFAFTGFTGFVLGPTINAYIHHFSNGTEIVLTSLGATGVIFLSLSGYVLTTKKDFSYMGGFLFVGMIVAALASIGLLFFQIPALQLAISAAVVLLASGLILFDTSRIIQGGEDNYIMATISLYLDIYMLFVNLLSILGITSGKE